MTAAGTAVASLMAGTRLRDCAHNRLSTIASYIVRSMAWETGNSCGSAGVDLIRLTREERTCFFARDFFLVEVLARSIETISYIISATEKRETQFLFQRLLTFSTPLWKWAWKMVLTLARDS
jgi:hypothetical protein